MRPLTLSHLDTGWLVQGPVVIESTNPETHVISNGISAPTSDSLEWGVDNSAQHVDLADGEKSVTITPDATSATIPGAEGRSYTVRRVVDEDGLWASKLSVVAPAEALEDLYGGSMANTDESLWVALDPDTEEFKELIYSSPTGIYARSDGNWFRYPDDDTSLDGMESIDVGPKIVDAFDKAELRGTPLTRDSVLKYEVETLEEDVTEPSEEASPEVETPAEDATETPDQETAKPAPDDTVSE